MRIDRRGRSSKSKFLNLTIVLQTNSQTQATRRCMKVRGIFAANRGVLSMSRKTREPKKFRLFVSLYRCMKNRRWDFAGYGKNKPKPIWIQLVVNARSVTTVPRVYLSV